MNRLDLLCLAYCIAAAPGLAQSPAPAAAGPTAAPDAATVPMPKLDFAPTAEDQADYAKYFYFHRDGTSFAEAYADVKECDAVSSGISYYGGETEAMMSRFGIITGAVGSTIVDAIRGSAERRKMRRLNMRNCMGFKGYQRYGLRKDLWEVFNFEEGNGRKPDDERETALRQQARAASGPKPPQQTALRQ